MTNELAPTWVNIWDPQRIEEARESVAVYTRRMRERPSDRQQDKLNRALDILAAFESENNR